MLSIGILLLAANAAPVGLEWQNNSFRDAMTDKAESHAFVENENGRLAFLCRSGDRNFLVMVQPRAFLGGGLSRYDLRDTYYRIDDQAPVVRSWKYVDNYAVPYDKKAMEELTSRVLTASRIRIRLETFKKEVIDLEFDTNGAAASLRNAASECGIPL